MAVFLLVFGVVAEVWLRTVMPASETPMSYQQQPSTVFRMDPHGPTDGRFSHGRLCRDPSDWRVNGAGWNSGVDYGPAAERRRPLVALFGDSYIEGFLTDVDAHVDAYLPEMLPGVDCYAFGLSGWYLEQYVAASRYVRERYQPDVLVIVLGRGDVSDSLRENGTPSPFWWQIGVEGQSHEEYPPTAVYSASRKARMAKRSALVNYLRYNAKLALPGMRNAAIPQPAAQAGTAVQDDAETADAPADDAWRDLLPAADFMVDRLVEDHPGTPIVFAAQSDRYLPLQEIARRPLFPDARAVQAACADQPRCSLIDLRFAFSRDWAANGVRFEAADGAHWNAHGNRVVARRIADHIERNDLL